MAHSGKLLVCPLGRLTGTWCQLLSVNVFASAGGNARSDTSRPGGFWRFAEARRTVVTATENRRCDQKEDSATFSESSGATRYIWWVPRLHLFLLAVTLAMTMAEFIEVQQLAPADLRTRFGLPPSCDPSV